ncbi:hypothetical protein EYF80_016116 [Liparis tanakae]|uniref:Uncharacterized protein n=1 Tax=Liparis tanakae TaxID=230148 RepID=A0A4Z2I6Q7_9TELE|nr:hypothetical protein EYF80_016116 [Liparis tanakae]
MNRTTLKLLPLKKDLIKGPRRTPGEEDPGEEDPGGAASSQRSSFIPEEQLHPGGAASSQRSSFIPEEQLHPGGARRGQQPGEGAVRGTEARCGALVNHSHFSEIRRGPTLGVDKAGRTHTCRGSDWPRETDSVAHFSRETTTEGPPSELQILCCVQSHRRQREDEFIPRDVCGEIQTERDGSSGDDNNNNNNNSNNIWRSLWSPGAMSASLKPFNLSVNCHVTPAALRVVLVSLRAPWTHRGRVRLCERRPGAPSCWRPLEEAARAAATASRSSACGPTRTHVYLSN